MKNKSKLKKIKTDKKKEKVVTQWFYMSQNESSVRVLYEAFIQGNPELKKKTEIWEEMGVLELELSSGNIIDIEQTRAAFRDEYSQNFLEKNQVKSMYYVSIPEEDYEEAVGMMKQITGKIGGFFCGDTEDFKPVVGK